VLFDSNVFSVNDADEQRLHALTELLLNHPGQGNFWFSLMTLTEITAPADRQRRIELLKRFRNLYRRFGNRVRFMRSLEDNIKAECASRPHPSADASVVDKDTSDSIASGDLVGLLKEGYEDWRREKVKIRNKYDEYAEQSREGYAQKPEIRLTLKQVVPQYFSLNGLEQCDDIAKNLLTDAADANPSLTLDDIKTRHKDYPCIWTFALLARLAQYAFTIPDAERKQKFPSFERLLEPHPNDFIDADIAATGAHCGTMITNDRALVAKLNSLYDANLIRMQGFTVSDALIGYIPPISDRTPTHEEIAGRAYEIYLARGGQHGHDVEDWLQAEHELRFAQAVAIS
jgi:hypothetical protein